MNRGNTCLHLILILYNKPVTLDNKHYKKINIVVCFVFGVSYYNNPKWNRMLRNKKKIPYIFEKSCRGYIFVGKISYTLFHAFSLLKSRVILLLPFSRFQLYKRRRPPDISL